MGRLTELLMILFNLRSRMSYIHVVDNYQQMRQRYAHLSSQKRGDLAILSTSNYLIYDQVSRQPRSEAIADVKMISLVNSRGTWTPAKSRNKDKIENPGLVQQEQIKNRKHADFYAPIGFAFFPFVETTSAPLVLLQSGAFSPLLT